MTVYLDLLNVQIIGKLSFSSHSVGSKLYWKSKFHRKSTDFLPFPKHSSGLRYHKNKEIMWVLLFRDKDIIRIRHVINHPTTTLLHIHMKINKATPSWAIPATPTSYTPHLARSVRLHNNLLWWSFSDKHWIFLDIDKVSRKQPANSDRSEIASLVMYSWLVLSATVFVMQPLTLPCTNWGSDINCCRRKSLGKRGYNYFRDV